LLRYSKVAYPLIDALSTYSYNCFPLVHFGELKQFVGLRKYSNTTSSSMESKVLFTTDKLSINCFLSISSSFENDSVLMRYVELGSSYRL